MIRTLFGMRVAIPVMLALASLPAGPLRAEAPIRPAGDAFAVNSHETGEERAGDAIGLEDRFVVWWWSPDGADGKGPGTFLRIVGADGTFLSDDLRIASDPYRPSISRRGTGLIMVWSESSGEGSKIIGRFLSAFGLPEGEPFRVASGDVSSARVAGTSDGSFVISWTDDSGPDSVWAATIYSATGEPSGSFSVNIGGAGFNRLEMRPDGTVLFAFDWSDAWSKSNGVILQRYDRQGNFVGGYGEQGSVASLAYVSRLVVSPVPDDWLIWRAYPDVFLTTSDGLTTAIWDDESLGWTFAASTGVNGSDLLVVVWRELFGEYPLLRVSSSGELLEILETDIELIKGAARLDRRDVWLMVGGESYDLLSALGVMAQLYARATFFDGFESGDLGAWSAVVE